MQVDAFWHGRHPNITENPACTLTSHAPSERKTIAIRPAFHEREMINGSFAEDLFELAVQLTALQIYGNDLSFGIEKDVGGNAHDAVQTGSFALPTFQIGNLRPFHTQFFDGILPCPGLCVERNTHDFIVLLAFIFLLARLQK